MCAPKGQAIMRNLIRLTDETSVRQILRILIKKKIKKS
jgi:hypothetical protein